MNQKRIVSTDMIYIVCLIAMFPVLVLLFYRQSIRYNGAYISDTIVYIQGFGDGKNCRFITLLFEQLLKINGTTWPIAFFCAAVVVATVLAGYVLLDYMLNREGTKCERWKLQVLSFAVLFSGPIYLPGIYEHFYTKMWPKYAWHSPTEQSMVLFSILAMLFFLKVYDDGNYLNSIKPSNWIGFAVFLFMSAWSKPNFMMVLSPVVGLFFILELFRQKGHSIQRRIVRVIVFGSAMLPAGFFVIFLNNKMFSEGDSSGGIEILPGYFLQEVRHPFVMIILSMGFSLFVWMFNLEKLKAFRYRVFAWMTLTGIGEYLIFVEGGEYIDHGNFGWGRQIGEYLLFVTAVVVLIKNMSDEDFLSSNKKVRLGYFVISVMLLTMHVVTQIIYFALLLKGELYRM